MNTRYNFYDKDLESMRKVNFKRHTKASRMSNRFVNEKLLDEAKMKEMFKMRKFSRVAPRTNTNRGTRKKLINKTLDLAVNENK